MNKAKVFYDVDTRNEKAHINIILSQIVAKCEHTTIPAGKFKKGFDIEILNKHNYGKITLWDIIIIPGCPPTFDFESFMNVISDGIEFENNFIIGRYYPIFIFIANYVPEKILFGASYRERFDFQSLKLGF